MYDTQQALIAHLQTSNKAQAVKAYAGEIQKAVRDRRILKTPAILVMFITGKPIAEERDHQFDLLICTKSDVYDEEANQVANIQLAADVAEWLEANPSFSDATYNYELDPETLDAELLLQDDRFTIIALHVGVTKYSHL